MNSCGSNRTPWLAKGCGLVLLVLAPWAWSAETPTLDPKQALFEVGVRALMRQDLATAIAAFERLSRLTPSNRVKLELARAYFLDRRYGEARRLFKLVLADPAVPWAVRENIKRFLDKIDEAMGSVKLSIALVSDSNPTNVTSNREIDIAGVTVILEPSKHNRTVYGLEYGVKATKSFTDDASAIGYATVDFRDLEQSELDKWTADAGVMFAPRGYRKWQAKLGAEASTLGGNLLYRVPYVSATYFPDPVNLFRFSTEARLGYLDVPDFDYLDAHTQSVRINVLRNLSTRGQLSGNLRVDNAITDEKAYSYGALAGELTLAQPLSRHWHVQLSGGARTKHYRDTDPIFLERRRDLTTTVSASFVNRNWSWEGLTPEIGLSYERNQSNVAYFEYDKVQLIFRLAN